MAARTILCFLLPCLLVVGSLGAATTRKKLDGSCRNITPPKNFTLGLVEGNWLLYRTVERQVNHDTTDVCHRLKYSLANSTTVLAEYSGSIQQGYFLVKDTKKPWILTNVYGDKTMNIIFAPSDGSKLVATYCLPNSLGKGYYLFTKSSPISTDEVTEVERIVVGAGGTITSTTEQYYTWQSTATCSKK